MLLEIRGHHLPGRVFDHDDVGASNVHVGLQIGREPADLVAGDAETAEWSTEIRVKQVDGVLDFAGSAVQGRRGGRFIYLTWGDVGEDGAFAMFRRAKLMLDDIDPVLVVRAEAGGRLIARVDLTDEHGGPRCARLKPPALSLTVERATTAE